MKRMNKRSIVTCLLLGSILGFVSCTDKFLDELPSKSSSLPLTNTAQLDAILANYRDFWAEANKANIYASDDVALLTGLYKSAPGFYSGAAIVGLQAAVWDYNNLINAQSDDFWSKEFSKIFRANMVLNAIDKVSGMEDEKARLKAEAHFIRAYSYWVLANTYCLPYTEANKGEMGLPLKTSTSFEEPVGRATLEDTYKFIEADLQEALKSKQALVQNGAAQHWRANTAGINGFAARYYLNLNNYQVAMKYADAALAEYNTLVDYNTGVNFGFTFNINVPGQGPIPLQFPSMFTTSPVDYTTRIAWKENMYIRVLDGNFSFPSSDLLAAYDTANDLRYKYNVVEHLSYMVGAVNPAFDYPGYVFYYITALPSGITTGEMYLVKAECQARLGDFNGGIATLNILRAKRMKPGPWVNLAAVDKADAIKKILLERRREIPFTQRWFDLRRYNNNDDPNDDVTVTKSFFKFTATAISGNEPPINYTLEKNSRKYALPINNVDIVTSNGIIKQNTY
ncbi:RagB/SusD family nutrient uptake outer membrane protein [Chitinophaga sp. OAE865]|uniref:RagB/SusD family nutrient uptake outer membrane protein n=1 Tax=Chitinophaga sp. OAE865 TaxID=2817898 RepID=UPI001AE6FC1A